MDHDRNENGEISGVYTAHLQRPHGEEVQAGCRHREWQDLGHLDGGAWSSWAKLDQSFQTPTAGFLQVWQMSYLWAQEKVLGRQERLDCGLLGELYQN